MPVLKPVMIAGCPNIRRSLEMLATAFGAKKPIAHKCPPGDMDSVDHAAEIREILNGSTLAIVGIGGYEGQRYDSMHALRRAAHTHKAIIVVMADAWDPFIQWLGQLPAHERKFMSLRVISGILVGKDVDQKFPGFSTVFPEAAKYSIGGLGWAESSCIAIAGHIAKTALAKQAA